jgi:hypothetical protein
LLDHLPSNAVYRDEVAWEWDVPVEEAIRLNSHFKKSAKSWLRAPEVAKRLDDLLRAEEPRTVVRIYLYEWESGLPDP